MAASTIGSEFSIMNVIGQVAVGTVASEACLCRQGLPVTGLAVDPRMGAFEFERGLRIVVENPLLPVDRVVAERALLAEAPIMRIVFAMAIDALLGRIAEDMRIVALVALLLRVFSQQGEASQIVVEEHVVLQIGRAHV